MEKIRKICLSPLFLVAVQILLSLAIAAGAVFYPYANVIIYRLWKIVLIDITFVLCAGAMFALVYFEKHTDSRLPTLLIPFAVGAGVFSLFFFVAQAVLSHYLDPTTVRLIGISIALAFDLACVVAQVVFAVRRDRRYSLIATVFLAVLIYVGTMVLSCLILPHGTLFKALSKDKIEFSAARAEEYRITDVDRAAGKNWMDAALLGDIPAFSLRYEGRLLSDEISSWSVRTITDTTNEAGDRTLIRAYTHTSGVEARVEAAYYDLTATVEWTVYVTNQGGARSAILSDLYALDASLPLSASTLYFSGGSSEANDDFALYSRSLGKRGYTFDTVKGRSSMLYLPFFNFVGEQGGATIGIGWSGDWTATIAGGDGVSVRVGQSVLEGYLDPGESVRTPLVSICLYGGKNPLKGFNNFRADIRRGLGEDRNANTLMFAGAEGQDDTTRAGASGTKGYVEKLLDLRLIDDVDYAWYDAGWYDTAGTGDWRASVGDWKTDAAKYPEGFGAVSSYLGGYGVKTLLWYEPERVPMTSDLYRNVTEAGHTSWIIEPMNGTNDCLWNMGDPDALAYMVDRISSSLIENGVAYYRQDFNIDPKEYWESADRRLYNLRKGFAENKYVTGEYAFLDTLRERIPELLIDNCASGGRRIDLEMCRRSVPLWRSDYQCKKEMPDLSEAAQYQTYGLSLWLPYSAITNPNASTEYDFRSILGGCVMCYGDVLYDAPEAYAGLIRDYRAVKDYYAMNYYPLTSCTPRSKCVAMQFGDEHSGVIVVYAREGQKGSESIVMNGLSRDAHYVLRSIEGGNVIRSAGHNLMQRGFTVETKERTAYIVLYSEE